MPRTKKNIFQEYRISTEKGFDDEYNFWSFFFRIHDNGNYSRDFKNEVKKVDARGLINWEFFVGEGMYNTGFTQYYAALGRVQTIFYMESNKEPKDVEEDDEWNLNNIEECLEKGKLLILYSLA